MTSLSKLESRLRRRSLAAGFLFFCLLVLTPVYALAQAAEQASPATLAAMLKRGGYNVYVRHAATDWGQSDRISSLEDTSSCDKSRVRQLSEKGRQAARETGAALKALGIKFGKVYSSPYCRSAETARLMSGKEPEPTEDLMNLRSAQFVGGREAVVERARARLSQAPEAGVNNLLSAHGNLGKAATGEYLGEGELLVVMPRGKGEFDIEGRLKLGDLEALAGG